MISQEKTMLYLTDLPFGIGIPDIDEFLSNYRDKIILINPDQNPRNKNIRKPLAIKVLFKDYESANKCRIEMNLRKLRGKSIRIMWDERDVTIRYNTKSNLFIKGIPKSVTPREVYEYFLQFGDISSCKISEDDFGNHNGYGYITYYNIEDAQKAIDESKDKKIFDSNNIEISPFQKRNERIINSNDNRKIYINNIPEKYTKEDLEKLCNEFGKVEDCNIFIDKICKNFGIVQFSSENEAKEALNKLNGKEIDGNRLSSKIFQTKYEHKQYLENSTKRINEQNANCNLLIKNIPLTVKEEDLTKIFTKYGNVISSKIVKSRIEKKEEKGKFEIVSEGFGYISFDKPEGAKNAMEDLDGKFLPGFESWSKPLIIELFIPKKERQLENTEMNNMNYFMPQNNLGPYQYTFPYYSYPQTNQWLPQQFNKNNNYLNNYSYGYKRNYNRGGNKNNYRIYRNNNFRGKKNYNNRQQYNNEIEEEEKNKNKLDLTEYHNLENEQDKKDYLGEKIFKAIGDSEIAAEKKIDMETIGKITGMIIELPDKKEIIEILENPNILRNRIEEALNLLEWKE